MYVSMYGTVQRQRHIYLLVTRTSTLALMSSLQALESTAHSALIYVCKFSKTG